MELRRCQAVAKPQSGFAAAAIGEHVLDLAPILSSTSLSSNARPQYSLLALPLSAVVQQVLGTSRSCTCTKGI